MNYKHVPPKIVGTVQVTYKRTGKMAPRKLIALVLPTLLTGCLTTNVHTPIADVKRTALAWNAGKVHWRVEMCADDHNKVCAVDVQDDQVDSTSALVQAIMSATAIAKPVAP